MVCVSRCNIGPGVPPIPWERVTQAQKKKSSRQNCGLVLKSITIAMGRACCLPVTNSLAEDGKEMRIV